MRTEKEKRRFFYGSSYLFRVFSAGFATLFFVPLFILLYIFFYLASNYDRPIKTLFSKEQLEWIILLLTSGSLFFFASIRKIFEKIFMLSARAKDIAEGKIDKEFIAKLTQEKGEVASLANTFKEIINKLEDDIQNLEDAKKRLHKVLEKVGKFLISIEDFDSLIYLVLEATVDALQADIGIVFSQGERGEIGVRSVIGLVNIPKERLIEVALPLIEEAKEKEDMFIYRWPEDKNVSNLAFLCAPLVFKKRFWGVVCLGRKKNDGQFSKDEKRIVANLSAQIAVAFDSAALTHDKEKTYFETIAALAMAVEAKDTYSRGHSERVGKYTLAIGREIGLKEEDLNTLYDASRLHDIGKIGIADSILNKPGRLSVEERKIIERHPEIGEKIIQPLKTFRHLLPLIRHHHEFLDGSGYPDKLQAEALPLAVRILTVADIYDALTTDRPYRKALGLDEAIEELRNMAEQKKIDGKIVEVIASLAKSGRLRD